MQEREVHHDNAHDEKNHPRFAQLQSVQNPVANAD
jgi:hypothetical protein